MDELSDALIRRALEGYVLPEAGTHGVGHWARVAHNGALVAAGCGADALVVAHFALWHDCRRRNESRDPGHGHRAAVLVRELADELPLDADQLAKLIEACEGHTAGETHDDLTIGACWDADRLDLPRVGYRVDPAYLSTPVAASLIAEATARARSDAWLPAADRLLSLA